MTVKTLITVISIFFDNERLKASISVQKPPVCLQNCLGLIYTVYMENMSVELETLIGNILGCIQVPPPGGPQVRFSIGAGDRQALQPPLSTTLPVTHTAVAMLYKQLGERIQYRVIPSRFAVRESQPQGGPLLIAKFSLS